MLFEREIGNDTQTSCDKDRREETPFRINGEGGCWLAIGLIARANIEHSRKKYTHFVGLVNGKKRTRAEIAVNEAYVLAGC